MTIYLNKYSFIGTTTSYGEVVNERTTNRNTEAIPTDIPLPTGGKKHSEN